MSLFEYKALTADGQTETGRLEAGGRMEALQQLRDRGWTALRLAAAREVKARPSPAAFFRWRRKPRVSASQLEDFTRSLASLLAAGVPLSRALTILYREDEGSGAGAKWKEIHDRVIDGVSLAEAMSRSPDVFPRVYIAMVESGETGGFLDIVLSQIADFQARDHDLRANVIAALIYPCVLLALATAVLVFLLVFFIPRFQTLFEGFDATLPALTRAIVGVSDMLRHHGVFVLAGIALLVAALRPWLRGDAGRRRWEKVLLAAPVVGPLAARLAVSRFCRMLGTLLAAGVPLLQALRVARRSLGYQTQIDLIAAATDRVQQGEPLSASLRTCKALFPGSTIEMITVAEESGRLDEELVRLSADMEKRLDRQLKTAVALAEPLMLFLIAGLIGVIFLGMVIPIFTIQDYIK